MALREDLVLLVAVDRRSYHACRDAIRPTLLNGVVDQERFQEIAGNVAYSVPRNVVNEELYLFEMHKPAFFIFGNDPEELQNLASCRATDSSALARVGVTKTHLITFAQGGQSFDRLRAVSLPFEVAEMIKGIDKRGVQRIVLLRRRAPEQEGIQIKGDVLVEKRDSEVGFVLGNEDAVIVRQARPDYRHNAIVANERKPEAEREEKKNAKQALRR